MITKEGIFLMENLVKFTRGSLKAYQNLKEKDSNTLYFITDTENDKSFIFLGDSPIVDDTILKGLSFQDISDINILTPRNGDILVYNKKTDQWENSSQLNKLINRVDKLEKNCVTAEDVQNIFNKPTWENIL